VHQVAGGSWEYIEAEMVRIASALVRLVLPALAQVATVQGTVEDLDHRSLAGVSVRIERQNLRDAYSARTQNDGTFLFGGLTPGVYRVLCEVDDPSSGVTIQLRSAERTLLSLSCLHAGIPQTDRAILNNVSSDLERAGATRALDEIAAFRTAWEAGHFDWEMLGVIDSEIGKLNLPDEAAHLKDLTRRWRRDLQSAFDEGKAYLAAKNYRAAIAQFHRAAVAGSQQAVIWANLAQAYSGAGWHTLAADTYAKALELNPQETNVQYNYALDLAKSGKVEDAVAQIEEAARLNPTSAATYFYNLGAVFVNAGRVPEARAAFQRSTLADPDYADAHFQYALSLLSFARTNRSGRLIPDSLIREVREELEAYLRLAPRGKYAETVQKLIETISGVQLIG